MSGAVTEPTRVSTVGTAPGIFPFVSHAIALFRRPLDFLNSLPAQGDLVELRLGPQRAWMICDPQLVHLMLMDPHTFDKGGTQYDRLGALMGNGIVTCPQSEHRRQRTLLQPGFHPSRIPAYTELMAEEAEALCREWRAGEKVDVTRAMMALTTRVTSRVLFSGSLDAERAAVVRECLAAVVRGLFARTVVPVDAVFRIPTPANRRYQEALRRLHALIDTIIAERREAPPREDLLGTLLAAHDGGGAGNGAGNGDETGVGVRDGDAAAEGPRRVSDREIHDQLITLLLTGVETTAMCLASAFSLLAVNPEAERALHREVDAVLRDGQAPGQEELARLEYTRCVVTETLRVCPPGWLFTRITTRETELGGHRLPRGAMILYSPYLLHHDPASFPEPERFLPERWLPERETAVRKGAMLPFAAGNRKCIGDRFAMAEAMVGVATVAAHWRLRPVSGHDGQPRPAVTLGPRALVMLCEPRQHSRHYRMAGDNGVDDV
ncbi:cytochrome P450 [Streptomyces spinoverrucosus]|uniref:cytochrome P450 n=1 Tax=Streptomyces spinoverrucosus TaxID=284043 RepID=UPI0018C38396|nr:cytochrome P450 [Streptomyces spinoverrucosus]MBG0857291.1 cytochrome P450 [Streptomyces spinoverrucosus]